MKKDFFKTICPADADIFIAEQGRAQTYQRTSQGIKSTVQGINIDISFFSPVTVRILKSPDGWKYTKESLSVIGQPEKVKLSVSSKGGILTIKSHQLTVHLNEETGQITLPLPMENRCCRNKIKAHVLMISTMPAQKPSAFINRSP